MAACSWQWPHAVALRALTSPLLSSPRVDRQLASKRRVFSTTALVRIAMLTAEHKPHATLLRRPQPQPCEASSTPWRPFPARISSPLTSPSEIHQSCLLHHACLRQHACLLHHPLVGSPRLLQRHDEDGAGAARRCGDAQHGDWRFPLPGRRGSSVGGWGSSMLRLKLSGGAARVRSRLVRLLPAIAAPCARCSLRSLLLAVDGPRSAVCML